MDNHIDQVDSVTFVETISRRNSTSENICKKHLIIKKLEEKNLKVLVSNISNTLLDKKSPVNSEAGFPEEANKQTDKQTYRYRRT